ncbi:DUF1254 domain-containing protein [Polycladidibacter hongkongensis]|uniref:DUF1254 domain-containing protein n=1 Tax=Polycladidibacter hongkongensis TaxID=1647556 RepID=UPI001AD8FCC3|nr:hypothetical protein [Pseudovibrio hongkongensis]
MTAFLFCISLAQGALVLFLRLLSLLHLDLAARAGKVRLAALLRWPLRLRRLQIKPSWVLWGLAGFLLGGIIHILIVLSVPTAIPFTLYEQVARFGHDRSFNLLPPVLARTEPLLDLDPSMEHALCRFDLARGPVRLDVDLNAPYWSLAYFNERGQTLYSLNDSSAAREKLAMLILSEEQLSVLRENPPEELEDMIVVESDAQKGFVMLRAFVPHKAYAREISAGLRRATCTGFERPPSS